MNLSRVIRETLKKYRQNLNLSQEQLAESANLDRTYISGFERGIRNISLQSLEKILAGLNLNSIDFLNLCINEIRSIENEKSI